MSGISLKGTPTGADLIVGGATIARLGNGAPDPISLVRVKDAQRVLLASGSASNSASVVLSWADTSFDHYEVTWDGVGSGQSAVFLGLSDDGGVTFPKYSSQCAAVTGAAPATSTPGVGGSVIDGWFSSATLDMITNSTGTAQPHPQGVSSGVMITVEKYGIRAVGSFLWFNTTGQICNTSQSYYSGRLGNIPINAIKFYCLTSNITTGTFRLYGIR